MAVKDNQDYDDVTVHLDAVTAEGQGENSDYSKWTPSASLDMTIDNGTPARDFFEEGEFYYLDFSSVKVAD